MPRVAIVAALEREVRPLVRHWSVTDREHGGRRFRFYEHDETVLVCGGIGSEAARRSAEAIMALFEPNLIYSAGFAGALDSRLKVGDVVRPQRVVDAGDGSSVALAAGDGVLVSFASIASPAQKVKLRESFGAQAVDMEAAAVARSVEARGKEFAVVKVISDELNFNFPSMERFVDTEGKFAEGRFAWFTAVRPWLWPKVARLARNSNLASRVLCDWLRNITADQRSISGQVRASEAIHGG